MKVKRDDDTFAWIALLLLVIAFTAVAFCSLPATVPR